MVDIAVVGGKNQAWQDIAPGVLELWPIEQLELGLVLKSGNFRYEQLFLTVLRTAWVRYRLYNNPEQR